MHDIAIALSGVGKIYRCYNDPVSQALDVLGLARVVMPGRVQSTDFAALRDINLRVHRGERVGIVGRNGAGKTTLLKLITGNFLPTAGTVRVDGTVQALMSVGLGFHPEFSGYENVRSALVYNGLSRTELDTAVADVVDFAELGEFLDRPMKTYSMGMQARLMFAAATAVRPDILIVDEVLGAGDAYFAAKAAHRMEKLTKSGCTLLLVSHSMQQVLQFCERAVWLENGSIVRDGKAIAIVKAFEEYMQKLERAQVEAEARARDELVAGRARNIGSPRTPSILENSWLRERLLEQVLGPGGDGPGEIDAGAPLSAGGISRWGGGEPGLRIDTVRLCDDEQRVLDVVRTGEPLNIEVGVVAEQAGLYPCHFVILLFGEDGRWLTRHCSECYQLHLGAGERYTIHLRYPRTLLGNGTYYFSAAIYKSLDLTQVNESRFYDLLSRSFEFKVVAEYRDDQSIFHHPATWVRPSVDGTHADLS